AVILLGTFTARGQEVQGHQLVPSATAGPQPVLPRVDPREIKKDVPSCSNIYPDPNLPDRQSYCVPKTQRGTTLAIPETDVIKFCSGKDGCIVRMGMYNWDDTGRVASRHFLFYYNKDSKVWRAEAGDTAGTNQNGIVEHVANF